MSIISRYKPKQRTDQAANQSKFKVGDLVKDAGWGPYIITAVHEAWGTWEYKLVARDWMAYDITEPEERLSLWIEGVDKCVE